MSIAWPGGSGDFSQSLCRIVTIRLPLDLQTSFTLQSQQSNNIFEGRILSHLLTQLRHSFRELRSGVAYVSRAEGVS